MLEFLGQLVHVLAALVEFAEPHNFIVSDLDLIVQFTRLLIQFLVLLHQVIILGSQLVGSLIGSAKLSCPLLIFDVHSTTTGRLLAL